MNNAYSVLVVVSILLTMWFLLDLGRPWRSRNSTGAWLWAAMGWSTVLFDLVMLAALRGVQVWAWLAFIALAAQDAVYAWRLFLLRRARRDPTDREAH